MTSMFDKRFQILRGAAVMATACLALPAGAETPVDASDMAEFPTETAALVAATAALFDAVEAGGARDKRRQVIAAPFRAIPARAERVEGGTDILTARGPVDHLTGYRITWYPVDRFLGAVDFMGTWNGNRDLVCGFVTWDLTDPEVPVLDDISATFVDVSDLATQGDADIHAALLDANCAYGAIEANYAFFE